MKILFNDLDIETDKNNINDVDKSIDSEKDSNNEEIPSNQKEIIQNK